VTYIAECIKQREGELLSCWPYQLRVTNVCLSLQSFTRLQIIATFLDEPQPAGTPSQPMAATTFLEPGALCVHRHILLHIGLYVRHYSCDHLPKHSFNNGIGALLVSAIPSLKPQYLVGNICHSENSERTCMASLSFFALGPMPYCLPNSLHVWQAFHISTTTCLYTSIYIQPSRLPAGPADLHIW